MPVYDLYPDAERDNSGGTRWNLTTTSGRRDALKDNSDSTYVLRTYNSAATLKYSMDNVSLPAGEVIESVQVIVRTRSKAGAYNQVATCTLKVWNDTKSVMAGRIFSAPAAPADQPGTVLTTCPTADGNRTWTASLVNNVDVSVTDVGAGTSTNNATRLHRLTLRVRTTTAPTVTVTAPTGTITDTSRPTVRWAVSDTDDGQQSKAQIRVMKRPGTSWPSGYLPTDNTPLVYGSVAGAVTTWTPGTAIAPGTVCRAYVRAAKTINTSQDVWSEWAYADFTVSPTPPTTPTLTGSWNTGSQSVTMTVTGAALPAGYVAGTQRFRVERSDDGQTSWTLTRGGVLTPTSGNTVAFTDPEAPRGQTVHYRVAAYATGTSSGLDVQTGWSSPLAVTTVSDGRWWLRFAGVPGFDIGGARVVSDPQTEVVEQVGVFTPRGSDAHVVVSGGFHGVTGATTVLATTSSEWVAVRRVLAWTDPLLIQSPFGDQQYVRVTGRQIDTTGAAGAPRYTVTLTWVQVDAGTE